MADEIAKAAPLLATNNGSIITVSVLFVEGAEVHLAESVGDSREYQVVVLHICLMGLCRMSRSLH